VRAEVYERELYRLCLGCGLRYLLSSLNPPRRARCRCRVRLLVLWRASPQCVSVQLVLWLGLISIPEC